MEPDGALFPSEHTEEKRHEELPSSSACSDGDAPPAEEEWKPTLHEKTIIYTLALISLIVALDATVILTPLSVIARDLNASATQAFWIGTSYLLVNAVTMPVICAISNVIGRPICLTASLAAFTVGTICCCTADDIGQMLVGRSIQGIGGGGIHSLALVTLTDIVPLRYRPKWYGVTLGSWALGLAIGPIIGGAVVHGTTWRWIFYLMFPVCGFGLVAVPYFLTLRPKDATALEKLSRIDWFGSFIFIGSTTSFLIAICWGGSEYPWNSAQTLVPLILGIVGLVATAVYETYFAKYPLLRRTLFHDTSSIMTYVAGFFQGLIMYGLLYYAPFYFQSIKGFTPLDTGIAMLPVTVTVTLAGIISGRLVTRYNNYRWSICIGWWLASVGAALIFVWPWNDSAPIWVIAYLIIGTGQGIVLNAQNFASQGLCLPGDEAFAAAMYAFSRQFGMAFGVGIGGTIFQNVMSLKLRWVGLPTEIATQAEAYIPELHALPPGPSRDNAYDAYRFGFTGAFGFYLGVSVLAFLTGLVFIKNVDLSRNLESEHHLDEKRMSKKWNRNSRGTVSSSSGVSDVQMDNVPPV
ncbi:major facilitator superfamily transporter [Xylariomycetidae sp. FL2044]|nr:major facilitator superfamily transporter [Xylariomycetidae sp. FL2044]